VNTTYRMDKVCYLDILEIAAQDQRQDAKNKIVRSLGEHFHHQQECYENIIL